MERIEGELDSAEEHFQMNEGVVANEGSLHRFVHELEEYIGEIFWHL